MILRFMLAALLAAGLASAQRGGGGGGRSRGGGDGDFAPNISHTRTTRLDTIADKLKLNKEQKEEATQIFDAAQQSANSLNEQIRNGRNQITSFIVQGKTSGEEYDKLMAAYTGVLSQMAGIEAQAYAKLYALLKPNQQSKAPQVFEEQMSGMFAGRNWRMGR